MGAGFTAYAVDLEVLSAVFGGKDRALVTRVEARAGKRLRHADEWFAERIAAGAPSLRTALEEIVDGRCKAKRHGFQYVYALELLCLTLGTQVAHGDLSYRVEQSLDPLLRTAKLPRLMKVLGKGVVPMPIPKTSKVDAYPVCGSLLPDGVDGLRVAIHALQKLPNKDEALTFALAELREWVEGAKERGLVWFLY
ncbi:MAG: hypothetical protein IPJ34_38600 [Myxococcales bacterium]|nr:hypothetical protein [Myxococcales bacterium]